MKRLLVSLSLLFVAGSAMSQQNWCGTDALLEKQASENPEFAEFMHEQMIRTQITQATDRTAPYEIPVVFHIIHDNGEGNISMEQIEDGIRILNEDYNRTNPDASNTRNTATAPFQPEAGNCEVTFKLAKRDPNGNCTNGVVRVFAPSLTNNAGDNVKQNGNGGSSAWPRDRYLNIWVVNSISTQGEGVTLGYAYLPYSPNGSNYGILIRHDAVGSIGTSNADGRTLTHEMGHTLGLLHTFQGGWGGGDGCHTSDCSNNGDYCCDTPPAAQSTWACNNSQNSCSDIPTNDTYGFDANDQIENYMSYDACQNMFSKDQVQIMQNNMNGNIDFLTNLVSAANITASGINLPDQMCKADFISSENTICAGTEIDFMDESYHAPSGWTWAISGVESTDWAFSSGTDANSQNPKITFNNPGFYNITLTATDGVTTESETKNAFITVLPNPGVALPYSEGFESYANMNASPFFVVNESNDNTWQITNTAAASGSKSASISNFGTGSGDLDELISQPIDLSGVDPDTNVTLRFKYAYKKRSASNDEWLRFYVSLDCGKSWSLRKNIHGSQLSAETSSTPYTPAANEWTEVEVTNIVNFFYKPDFRYKFTFENDNGNNIYIDDINLFVGDHFAGVNSTETVIGNIALYPNPSKEMVNLDLTLTTEDDVEVNLVDLSGRTVRNIFNGTALTGVNSFGINKGSLNAGTYFVKIKTTNGVSVERIIFE